MTETQQLANDIYDKLLDNSMDKQSPFFNLDGITTCWISNTDDGNSNMYISTHQGKIKVTVSKL